MAVISASGERTTHGVLEAPPAVSWPSRLRRWSTNGLACGFVVSAALSAWILIGLGGGEYYATPLPERAYATAHRLLRPSGPFGQTFGVIGTALMLVPFAYMARKRLRGPAAVGTVRGWLEAHLFCGIVGPVLVTFHTSFKFNGIISAAYWSMIAVMLSGFVGRYLYVRIPRSIRGNELSRSELDAQAGELHDEIVHAVGDAAVLREIEALEQIVDPGTTSFADLVTGELRLRRHLRAFDHRLRELGAPDGPREQVVRLSRERALLVRRGRHLTQTRKLFELWHVFHLPLVYALLAIAAAHIMLALYMGYVPFRWS